MNTKLIFITLLVCITTIMANAQLKVGDTMPSITLKSNTNKQMDLAKLQGKYMLVDFWASWCAPCRLGNRKLVKLHTDLADKNIEIVGISIDIDVSKWLKAIEKDKIKFLQLIDMKGFASKSAILFGVEALPASFLFNEKGILIATNPTEEQIIKILN